MAELKLVKVGEASSENDLCNPEPSSSYEQACVESRRRVCIKCGNDLVGSRTKFCSDKCRSAYGTQQYRIRHNLIETPGCGSGGNQFRNKNHQWKGGTGTFRQLARETQEEICHWCKSDKNLLVHHIDHDRKNNRHDNLIIICKKCRQKHHAIRDTKTGRYVKGYSKPE